VLPGLRARTLLAQIKRLSRECGFPDPHRYKTHALRHHFASMCANRGVPYRLVLAWLGHSSSDILDLYYHLFDDESRAAMLALAEKGR
jgi:integrase/recombinase XerD